MTSAQTWKVPVTPAQRFVLLQLAHAEGGQKLKGQSGRVFRRFLRAFGIAPILETMDAHPVDPGQPQVEASLATNKTQALFVITAENLDYAMGLLDTERGPAMERTIGPLFDLLEDVKAGRTEALEEAVGIPDYDAAIENWAPVTGPDPVERTARDIAEVLRLAGEARAAELVEHGVWDVPASNGADAR